MKKIISVVGLGKLGSCMATVYARKGYTVIGVDLNPDTITAINQGQPPVREKNLQEFLHESHERISATTDTHDAVIRSDLTFIIVPTPSKEDGSFSTEYVTSACKEIGLGLSQKQGYHLVVLTSTVLPGDCERDIIPVLEQTSGKKAGQDFGFCYSPLFIAIGSVIQNLLHPDFFLVGESDARAGDILEAFYQTVCDNRSVVRRMSIPSAELTKISVNSYVTMKITFANMLGEVASAIPGVNIDDVTSALGHDKRIGSAYLKAGLGYGGPCFPRDNRAFARMAEQRGVQVPFADKTDEYNNSLVNYWVQKIKRVAGIQEPIACIGVSYKPGTDFAEESQAISIAKQLLLEGYPVHVYNPDGNTHANKLLGSSVTYHENLESCIQTTNSIFLGLPMRSVVDSLKPLLEGRSVKIIDPWRQCIWE